VLDLVAFASSLVGQAFLPVRCSINLQSIFARSFGKEETDKNVCPTQAPWHFLYFLPDPQGQGSLRPTFAPTFTGFGASACAGPV
jgi:hypothetical protein